MNMRLILLGVLCGSVAGNIRAMDIMTPEEREKFMTVVGKVDTHQQMMQLMQDDLNSTGYLEFNFTDGFYKKDINNSGEKIITDRMKVLTIHLYRTLLAVERKKVASRIVKFVKNICDIFLIENRMEHDIVNYCSWHNDPNFLPSGLSREQFDQQIVEFKKFKTINTGSALKY